MNRLGACKKGPIILCLSLLCSLHSSFAIAETEFALKDFKDAIFRLAIGESAHIRSMGLMSNSKIIADSTIYQTDLALDKLEFDVSGGQTGMSADLVAKIDKDRYSPASASASPLCTQQSSGTQQASDQPFRLDFSEILLLPANPSAATINVGRLSGWAVRALIFEESGLLLASDQSNRSIGNLLAVRDSSQGDELKLESTVRIEEKAEASKIKGYLTAAFSSLIPEPRQAINVDGELRLMQGTKVLGTWPWEMKVHLDEVFSISRNSNLLADRLEMIEDLKSEILGKLNCIERAPYSVSVAGEMLTLNAGESRWL